MIIAHEWLGEPHNSPSVRKLYRPDEPLIEYEWVGEDHNSESIKKVNGREVIRNLIPNPSFEHEAPSPYGSQHLIDHSSERSYIGGYSARAFQGWQNVGYNRLGARWTVESEAGFLAMRFYAYIPSTNKSVASRVNFQVLGLGPKWTDIDLKTDEWVEYTEIVELDEHSSGNFWVGFHTNGNQEGDEVWFDAVQMVHGYSEMEALQKLEEGYFDGDSEYEHGVVLARNLVKNPRGRNRNSMGLPMGWLNERADYIGYSEEYDMLIHRSTGQTTANAYLSNIVDGYGWVVTDIYNPGDHVFSARAAEGRSQFGLEYTDIPKGWTTIKGPVGGGNGNLIPISVRNPAPYEIFFKTSYVYGDYEGHFFDGDTQDIQIPETKVYYDNKWVSLYDYHSS